MLTSWARSSSASDAIGCAALGKTPDPIAVIPPAADYVFPPGSQQGDPGADLAETPGAGVTLASVHHHIGSGHPARPVRQQERHHVGDLPRPPEPAQGELPGPELREGVRVLGGVTLPAPAGEED